MDELAANCQPGSSLRLGRLDILVNNAGIIRRAPALEFSETDWDDVMQINLQAAFFPVASRGAGDGQQGRRQDHQYCFDAFVPGRSDPVPSYTAAKSGVAGITRALANEWAKHGINVNAIAPGYMATENTAALRADPNPLARPSSSASLPGAGAPPTT